MLATDRQIDAVSRLINTGVDRGANVLHSMIHSAISVEEPFVQSLDTTETVRDSATVADRLLAIVQMPFSGSLKGESGLVFQKQGALKLVDSLEGDETDDNEFDLVTSSIYTEIGNVVLNGVMGYISNALELSLNYVVPEFVEGDLENLLVKNSGGLLVRTRFKVENLATEGDVLLFFDAESCGTLLSLLEKHPFPTSDTR
jgi:chemotaxis protein CheC